MNDLRMVLETVYAVGGGQVSTVDLCRTLDVSVATLKRHIAEAQHLGAAIESVKLGRSWLYHCPNYDQCAPRLLRWIELERARSLV